MPKCEHRGLSLNICTPVEPEAGGRGGDNSKKGGYCTEHAQSVFLKSPFRKLLLSPAPSREGVKMTRNMYKENPLYIKIIERNDSNDNSNVTFQLWRKDQSLRIPEF